MRHFLLVTFGLISLFSYAQSWQDVGGGTNNSSHGLLVWNNKLVNLGSFNNPCNRVATWDGTQWECLDNGVGIVARAGCVWEGKLVVVGDFWNNFQPCPGCNGVAVWDGVAWTALDQGFNNDVLTCAVHNGELYIGGDFTAANGWPINRVAKWDTLSSTFVSVGNPTAMDNDVRCMTSYDGQLWVGGDFNNVDGCSPCDGLVKWDEANQVWEGGNSGVDLIGGVNETVRVLFVNPSDGDLYMGGHFPELWDGDAVVEDYNMAYVARYDGSNWFPLGTGLNEYVRAIHDYNGDVMIGGYFTDAGGTPAQKIVKWNPINETFTAMGGGFDGGGIDEYVKSAMTWNGTFFAGGAYTQAEGGPMNYIAQWFEPPTSPPTALINTSTTSICEGNCIFFSDGSDGSPNSWSWTFNGADVTSSSSQSPGSICYSTAGTYTVQLQACNSNGCDVQTVTVVVEAAPSLSLIDQIICSGNSVTLSATPSAPGGDFLWSPGNETTSAITVNPTSTSVYSVVYSLNGCASAVEDVTVTVNPSPTLTVNNSTICEGDNVTLVATPSVSGGVYNWQPNGETSSSITVSPTSTTTYLVDYTLNGCTSSLQSALVEVNPTYNLSAIDVICDGGTYIFPDGTSQTITSTVVQTSNLATVNGCDSTIVTTVDVGQVYNMTENIEVCEGESYTLPDGVSLTINTAISYTSTLSTTEGCDSIIITNVDMLDTPVTVVTNNDNVLSTNQSGAIYQWLDCISGMAAITGETNQTYTPINNGSYAVSINLNGCIATSSCVDVSSIGWDELNRSFTLFPNPANNEIVVKLQSEMEAMYKIYDSRGRLVRSGTVQDKNPICIKDMENGVYTIQINGYKSLRFVKM